MGGDNIKKNIWKLKEVYNNFGKKLKDIFNKLK